MGKKTVDLLWFYHHPTVFESFYSMILNVMIREINQIERIL
uniref:ORF40d n=1 Tax=Pinus koraiensis TaxID=88728 RepID=A4QMJ6_PINKO|nr:ORF40d [Pinus koraiensis]